MILSLAFAGCSSNSDEKNSEEIKENVENLVEENELEVEETENLDSLENLEQDILEGQNTVDNQNSTMQVEDDDVVVVQVNRTLGLESAPFSQWCIPGEIYTFEVEEEGGGSIESVIQGVSTHRGVEVCEAHHSIIEETPFGTLEIDTIYFIDEEITRIWLLTDVMGQVTETEIKLQ